MVAYKYPFFGTGIFRKPESNEMWYISKKSAKSS